MKAVRVHEFGPPKQLVYDEVAEPRPGPAEVIVAVAAAGVNPADYKFRNGLLAAAIPKLPFVPGMDVAGRIDAVGEGVTVWQVGDRVLAMLYLMGNGGYQEKVAVPAEWCARIPDGLDDATAAALPTPATTAIEWIDEGMDLQPGTRVLVTGAIGAVGRIACWAAKARGAHVTAAVRKAQVDDVVHADAVLAIDIEEVPPAGTFDCIADTIGGETAIRLLSSLKKGGTLSTVGTDPVTNPDGLDVSIVKFGNRSDAAVLSRAAKAVLTGDLSILPPRKIPMSDAATAHELVERGGAGKIVLITGTQA
jgi:NADPH:quinone reductase-like Zn-dependent oxidoreductase